MAHVTIYTTPTCGYCKMAKAFFKEHAVEYTERDVTTDQAAMSEALEKSGQTGVPVIDIDGSISVGFDPAKLKELLHIV
ncbi:glutaredoxin family protein [Candidatus Uhrbacteria bacterium]|nr:glutaredoxin family protein [Candidatus Uhrbacteria bacterium]